MWPFFEQSLTRYRELETQLGDPAVVANRARYTRAGQGTRRARQAGQALSRIQEGR